MIDDKYDFDFSHEVECIHKGERYAVRDNGEVFRYSPIGKRPRPNDNEWTFGKPNSQKGYMEIASVPIHRIVATAFYGAPPTKDHVVDHIDTNKQNNRAENLRWVTRLENILLNPVTIKRITIVCGSVEAFLADPSAFRDSFPEPNLAWMGTVSKEEGQLSLKRLLAWAEGDKHPSGGSLGEWIFNRNTKQNWSAVANTSAPDIIMSKTPGAAQTNWSIPCEFPCCPQGYTEAPILAYAEKLETGAVFCRNDVYSSLVSTSSVSDDHQSIYVICESIEGTGSIKPWTLAKITFEEELFVHENLHSFFTREGAEKQCCLERGLEWLGGETIDDYC